MGPVLQHSLCHQVSIEDLPEGMQRGPGDIMMIVKHYMADDAPRQVICVAPATRILALHDSIGLQPAGIAKRRPIRHEVRKNLESEVPQLMKRGFISTAAADYLLNYAAGTLPLPKRPRFYNCLNYRWDNPGSIKDLTKIRRTYNGEDAYKGVRAVVRTVDGRVEDAPAVEDGTDNSEVLLSMRLS